MGQASDPTVVVSDSSTLASGAVIAQRATNRGSLRTAQAEPYRAVGAANRFCYSAGVVANASIPVADMPTTAAAGCLWNGESAGGKSLVVECVSAHCASGTMGLGASLIVGLTPIVQAAAVANGTGVVQGRLSAQTGTTLAKFGTAITLSGAPAWFPVATALHTSAVQVGNAMIAWLDGLIIVPPGYCLGINVLAPTGTTAKFGFNAIWSEAVNSAY